MSWSPNKITSAVTAVEMEQPAAEIQLVHVPDNVETATTVNGRGPSSTSPNSDDAGPESQSQSQNERGTSITSSRPDQNRERATVPSACVQCRSKHLKCDGLNPCTRCSSNSFECVYVRSRRGFKGPRRNGALGKAASVVGTIDRSCPLVHPNGAPIVRTTPNVPSGLATPPDHRLMTLPRAVDLPLFDISQELVSFEPKPLPSGLNLRERCIEAFFYHFYPAHPFILSRNSFYALRKEKPELLVHLEACMRYVGSFYVPQAPMETLEEAAERSVYDPKYPKDGFKVQAMLILAIGLDGRTYQEKALQVLLDAQDIALELGMNKRDYAFMNGGGSDVLSESWRRTWWELYIVDGMIAGVHQKSTFRMKEIPADVALPCEEKEFASGQIPIPHSIEDFDDESFDGRDFYYSSFTYRIAAIRNLGRVLSSRQIMMPDVPTIERIDAYLVNWRLHLPESKKDFVNSDGQLDEMLFQAHMITEATTILLHREHSELDSTVARNVTSCAPHKPIVPGQSYNVHAAKTIQAAQDISKLIQLPVPLVKHTHFFTCVVTLASIVHLSCWSVLMPGIHDDDLKQQLRLNTGALKSLWQIWPSAGKAFDQVKGVAREIYANKKHAAEVGFWSNLSDDEVMRSMIEDQTIMEELQLLN
ncbi:uncharacterized protein LY89DRAFT_635115 [Mollisia scopiformis]|uniref:Zn(2)-C6 fungal-type domain-containing protein n=1 Tax=Mollisia scopiformis TaxID=149040 RepID=A0A194XRU7_MOLSC|nr:uncharacterized protein LY89DRAFT_635115 [Mollisia scopiformis]KUJ23015.1 hypothetical protein LY89DRAFT_635115 [Mollisia scopiformis]